MRWFQRKRLSQLWINFILKNEYIDSRKYSEVSPVSAQMSPDVVIAVVIAAASAPADAKRHDSGGGGSHTAPPDAGWERVLIGPSPWSSPSSWAPCKRVAESPGAITRARRDRVVEKDVQPASGRGYDSPKRWSWWLAWTTTSAKSSSSSATCSRRASSCSTGCATCRNTDTSSGRVTSGGPLTSTRSSGSSSNSTGEWIKIEGERESVCACICVCVRKKGREKER